MTSLICSFQDKSLEIVNPYNFALVTTSRSVRLNILINKSKTLFNESKATFINFPKIRSQESVPVTVNDLWVIQKKQTKFWFDVFASRLSVSYANIFSEF